MAENVWDQWLRGPHGLAFLSECARKIILTPSHRNLARKILHETSGGVSGGFAGTENDLLNSLVSELCILISEKPAVISGLQEHICQGNRGKAVNFLVRVFIQSMKDMMRSRSEEPWYGYYMKARRIISEQENFTYRATPKGSFFAACKSRDLPLSYAPEHIFVIDGFGQWPQPQVTDDHTPMKQELIRWAGFFYDHVHGLVGHDCLVPVRDFVNYVMAKGGLGWSNVVHVYPDQPAGGEKDSDSQYLELFDEELIRIPGHEQMADLAGNLFDGWSEKQKRVFCMKYYQELKLKDIAHDLGYAGASGVYTILNSLKDSLLETMAAWPGLSPPDSNEKLCNEFIGLLLSYCKNK